ncbi:MAG: FMN-binding protein, partial [Vicinamibacterales bacterium]
LVGYERTTRARQVLAAHPTPRGFYRDGTYSGWGRSIHGRVQATVVVRRGRVVTAQISTCRMRYPCSMIAHLPAQVVERQSAGVDAVTGATQSAEAFAEAIDRALAQALRKP